MPSTTKADGASRKHEDRVLLERYRRTGDSQLRDELVRVDQIADELTQALERSPTTAELSEAAGIDEEELLEVLQARSARGAISLQALVGNGAESGTLEERARARHRAHALQGGHDAGGDRGGHRGQPDADLTNHPTSAAAPARRRRPPITACSAVGVDRSRVVLSAVGRGYRRRAVRSVRAATRASGRAPVRQAASRSESRTDRMRASARHAATSERS